MFEGAHAGDDAFDITGAGGGESVSGGKTFAASAAARNNETGIDDGTDEGDAAFDGLTEAFFGVKGEGEMVFKETLNDVDVAEGLGALGHGDNNKEVVNITTIMFVAEFKSNETVELVEEDV